MDHNMDDIARLLRLKDAALDASARGDSDFYDGYLADDALALTPGGIADKAAILGAAAAGGFRSSGVDDVRAALLTRDVGVVTYVAAYPAADGGTRHVLTSTIYRRDKGEWKGVLYQQTPLAGQGR
jgi:hypothetical protein